MSLRPDFARYRCWVFDCDGVLLDSNGIKTAAFRAAALPYGAAAAEALVDYHHRHGGVSRFAKIDHLFAAILRRPPAPGEVEALLAGFAASCADGLRRCAVAPRLAELLAAIPADCPRIVVSGAEQDELRRVLAERGLAGAFTAIHGSPDSKPAILARQRAAGTLRDPAVFVGDSRTDYEAALAAGLDFVFASRWSEMPGWRDFFAGKPVRLCDGVADLLAE